MRCGSNFHLNHGGVKVLGAILILSGFSYLFLKKVYIDDSNSLVTLEDIRTSGLLYSNEEKVILEDVILELPVEKARYDNMHMLRIYDFHYTGSEWESLGKRYNVCFATQTSIERIYWIPYILENWSGPLSLAVHVTSEDEWLILNLYTSYLTNCHVTFRKQVAMHLAVPTNITSLTVDSGFISEWNRNVSMNEDMCPEARLYLEELLEVFRTTDKERLKLKEVYPQNHMRNIARKGCSTDWTYSADGDIIPREGMADMLQGFYESQQKVKGLYKKCAYVIPTFELNNTFPFPKDKKEMTYLFGIGAARSFNAQVYNPAQNATDYVRWTSTNVVEGPVMISHEILRNIKLYEPFYISPDTIPAFDERFLGYGFTRNSQFAAAYVGGWKFFVLTPVFSIHLGFQTRKNFHVPKKDGVGKSMRDEQVKNNRALYIKYIKELGLKKKMGML